MRKKNKYIKLRKFTIVILLLIIGFGAYVEIVNRNSVNMTTRQKISKAVYPLLMWFSGKSKGKSSPVAHYTISPPVSFYSLKDSANDGTVFDFESLRGKKVMLVNTASNCGYTGQYDDLQKLSEQYKGKLVVIGFPANDFKEQEKGNDEEIAAFCKINFGVTFPLMKKSSVIKGTGQNKVFEWLTDARLNGWSDKQPSWNFCKYIVNEEGKLTNYFNAATEPLGKEIEEAVNH